MEECKQAKEVFSSNSCILSGNCVPPGGGTVHEAKKRQRFCAEFSGQKLPLKTFDSFVLSSKERTRESL